MKIKHLHLIIVVIVLCSSFSLEKQMQVRISGKTGSTTTYVFDETIENEEFGGRTIFHKFDVVTRKHENDFVNGDILPSKVQRSRSAAFQLERLWPKKGIPLHYGRNLSLLALSAIEDARIEFELQTCLCFSDWTDESDYIQMILGNGCYSYIGRQGGAQSLSIGTSCETVGIVEHEIMHALGFYHEHSRPDRDDHVIIIDSNIQTDKDLAPYNYYSIMHYGESTMSANGDPTIVTINPAYQSIIGQGRSFSQGDVINMGILYSCEQTHRYSHHCNFENIAICGYTRLIIHGNSNWRKVDLTTDRNFDSFSNTDGTYGVARQGSYMLLANHFNESFLFAQLMTTQLKSKVPEQCLQFRYKISQNSTLRVFVEELSTTGEKITKEVMWQFAKDPRYWDLAQTTINATGNFKIVFEGSATWPTTAMLAIDDVNLVDKKCETAYFSINNYSQVLNAAEKGSYIFSNLFFTDDGYAFKALVYPKGSTNSANGYMSIFFCLAPGPHDDALEWPFVNRTIKLSVVDQQSNVLRQMNENDIFLTASDMEEWRRPVSTSSSCWGLPNFTRIDDLNRTMEFWKHDSLLTSIDIKGCEYLTQGSNLCQGCITISL